MEGSTPAKKGSIFSIFFTFAVDNLGATIVFPIFAPLFLKSSQGLITTGTLAHRTILLGLFLGIFPFMQFLCAPLLGEYADKKGRRSALIVTTLFTLVGFILSAYSIHKHHLILLFFSRLIMGMGASNLSICLSALSDISLCEKSKVRLFSYGSAIAGLTFILGPFVGGKLSDPNVNPLFTPAFPMFIGAVLTFVNAFFLILFFEETAHPKRKVHFDLIKSFHNIQIAFKTPKLQRSYLIYFFYLFAWNMVFLFTPAFFVQNFHISNSTIGDICALMGICWILGTFVINKALQGISHKKVLFVATLAFSAMSFFIFYPSKMDNVIIILGLATVFSGLIWPLCTGAISNSASKEMQGKILGLSQSMLSLTMMLSAVIGGLFLHKHSSIPFILAALSSLIACFFVTRTKI